MAGQGINVGGIYADLEIDSGKLDQGLAKARAALQAIDKEIEQLRREYADTAIGTAEFNDRLTALGNTANELVSRMNAAYTATSTLNTGLEILNHQAGSVAQGSGRMGQAMMQLGYIVDDVQYGFQGVVNNIAPLVYGLSGSSGIASAAQLAAVGIYQLYTHWTQFSEAILGSPIRTEVEEMDKLAHATKRTADEQERLNKFKEAQIAINKATGGKSKEETDTENAVQDVFNEAGGKKVQAAIAATFARDPAEDARVKKLDEHIAALKMIENNPDTGDGTSVAEEIAETQKARDKITKARKDQNDFDAGDLMVRAKSVGPEGDSARAEIQKLLGDSNNPLHGVAMQLQSASPEARASATSAAASAEARTKQEDEDRKEADRQKKKDDQEKRRKQTADDQDRQRQIGRLGFLEEQHVLGQTTAGEDAEMKRLQESEDEKKAREAEQAHKKNLHDSAEASPGIDTVSKGLALQVGQGGMSATQAKEAIAAFFQSNGRTKDQATDAAGETFDKAAKDVKGNLVESLLNPDAEDKDKKHSEVFDANSVAAQFQSSVGGDEAKKTNGFLAQMQKDLETMAKNGWVPNFN